MLKGQNRKVNRVGALGSIGKGSCVGLLALGLALMNPIGPLVFAEEGEVADGEVVTYSSTDSTVNIAFLPTSATGSVTPVNSGGDKAKVDVKATVRVQNSGGYSVYVGSNSSQLKNGNNVIDPVSTATTYANLPVNTWGYAFIKNGGVSNDTTTYNAIPATLRSTVLDANVSTNITDETRTYTLSFAANIGADKPAGTYTNSVTMSVVSSPLVVAEEIAYNFGGIESMQEMTSAICDAAPTGGVKQLRDTRDGKYYWIGKMKDGKCWMTQNLDLDLNEKTLPLTPTTSDVNGDWTPKDGEEILYTASIVNADTILPSNTGQRSWSLGDYSIINPIDSTGCGSELENIAACAGSDTKDRFRYYITPTSANDDTNAHYILGNYYQWNTATAGTGGAITSGQAESSICPKGWKLPESNAGTTGTFKGLLDAYEVGSSVAKLVSAPLYFVRGGLIHQDIHLLNVAGDNGRYWSSTSSSNSTTAYSLTFYSASAISSATEFSRQVGFSIRCIAK